MGLIGDIADAVGDFTDFFGESKPTASTGAETTRVVARFYADKGFDGFIDSSSDPKPLTITGFSSQKRFGGSPGSWTLRLKSAAGINGLALWEDPEDTWVHIFVVKNGKPYATVFGVVDTVTESMSRAPDGTRSVIYQIQGSDWQKVFTRPELYINIFEGDRVLPVVPLYNALKDSLIGRPDEVVSELVKAWLGNQELIDAPWTLPSSLSGKPLYQQLTFSFEETRGLLFDATLLDPNQWLGRNLWQSMEEFSNAPLNELFTRLESPDLTHLTTPPRTELVMRERPFPTFYESKRWNALPTWELDPVDIRERHMSRGAPESRYNFWVLDGLGLLGDGMEGQYMMQAAAEKGEGFPGAFPIYDMGDVRRHGFRLYRQNTRYLPWKKDKSWLTIAPQWLRLLHDWYGVTRFEQAGTLSTTNIKPMIQIGDRVVENRASGEAVTYYVEGVSHDYNYPGTGITQLHVTRGEEKDSPLIDLLYADILKREMDSFKTVAGLLDQALTEGDALTAGVQLGDIIPRGSPPSLDKRADMPPKIERAYLERRGRLSPSPARARAVTLQQKRAQSRKRAGDLPDRAVPDDLERLTNPALAEADVASSAGNLTQRQLERGTRLPTSGQRARNLDRNEPTRANDIDTGRARRLGGRTRRST